MPVRTLPVIVGPTGSGKTEVSKLLAQQHHIPVINADSRQIYRDIPIGTAAPTEAEQQQVKHYFVGTHSLKESYNAGQYERDAVSLIERLMAETDSDPIAILSGGSMMYADAVCYGLDDIPSVPSPIRQAVQEEYAAKGLAWLQEAVRSVDNTYFITMSDQKNPQRLMHALEIYRATERPYSTFRQRKLTVRPWRTVKIGLSLPRDILYQRINERVIRMMDAGLEAEARKAFEGIKDERDIPNSLCTVGYNEMWRYIRGEWSLEQTIAMIQQNSRRYAKRQLTWFRRQTDIHWVERLQPEEQLLKQINNLISSTL
ncbi:MAG: tRNA (adenosine(37)-N6)-dimethylallyltransferase MiaA [Paludibacteraceae bacterium]|nr:tRNA (adenosine(37)-N6)-dimethylallyltransferase MiaA [Paludibacteraceae bacterium]